MSAETGGWVLSKVLGVSARDYDGPMVAVTIRNSRGQEETLHATGGHPFWIQADPVASTTRFWKQFATSGGADADGSGWVLPTPQGLWVAAEQLQLGDQLLDRQDGPATITGLRITRERQRVYNLTVLRIHNYAVGEFGVLVHNGKCVGKGKKGTIYEVPGEGTPSGKPYIGRHNKPDPSQTRRSPDGRDRTKATVVDTYDADNVMEGRIMEQKAIDSRGGINNLDNKRNEIAPKKGG